MYCPVRLSILQSLAAREKILEERKGGGEERGCTVQAKGSWCVWTIVAMYPSFTSSLFTPGFQRRCAPLSSSRCNVRSHSPRMVASKEERAAEEIKRLSKQLEELRAKKARMAQQKGNAAAPVSPTRQKHEAPPVRDMQRPAESLRFGRHGEQSRFMSFAKVDASENYPLVVPVLDDFGSLTPRIVAETPNVSQTGSGQSGSIRFATIPPAYSGRLVALPGVAAIAGCKDPVAIAVEPGVIADNLSMGSNDKVVLVVERAVTGTEFDSSKFYVWGVGEKVHVGWLKENPTSRARCLGRVVCAFIGEPDQRGKARSCWEEEEEVY